MTAVKKIPQRKCIGCNQMKNKKELIRILKTQDDEIVIYALMQSALRKQESQRDLKELSRWQ